MGYYRSAAENCPTKEANKSVHTHCPATESCFSSVLYPVDINVDWIAGPRFSKRYCMRIQVVWWGTGSCQCNSYSPGTFSSQ